MHPLSGLDAHVIVVGAGPVGMTAAALLASFGLSTIVIEKERSPNSEPKAISLDDESLRTYQSAGIADRIMSIVVPGTGTVYYDANNEALFHAQGEAPYRLGHPFKNPFAQPDLEAALRDVLELDCHIDLRWGVCATSVATGDDYATVRTDQGDELRAFFVIGSDGGRSTVRASLNIDMIGRNYTDTWLVVDSLDDWHNERYGMHHGDPDRPHVIVPGLHGRCRYEFLLRPGEGEPGERPSLELMQRLVSRYRSLTADQIERAVVYRFNALCAARWSNGRIFLAGDAAHMMPPFAGQGLNSGIRDVANLCWKLASVVAGHLRMPVLETYERERRPHAEATIRLSERLGKVVMTTSRRLAEWRDARIRSALATPEGKTYLEAMRYRPENQVRSELVIESDDGSTVGRALGQPRAFDTTTHTPRMLDDIIGNTWALIGVGVNQDDWSMALPIAHVTRSTALHIPINDRLPRGIESAKVLVDLDGGLDRVFEPYRGRFVLIRPDRIVSAAWKPGKSDQTAQIISRWFEKRRPETRYVPGKDSVVVNRPDA